MKTKADPIEFDEFLDRPVAYHRIFKLVAGSPAAGVMLSQANHWSTRGKLPNGWFYKTVDEWEDETALTRYEQETARKKLRETGFWQEDLRGVPAKLHFRIDRPKLRAAMKVALIRYKEEREKENTRRSEVAQKRAQIKFAVTPRTSEDAKTSPQHCSVPERRTTADSDAEPQRTNTESTQRVPETTSFCGQQDCPQVLDNSENEASVDQGANETDVTLTPSLTSSPGTGKKDHSKVEVIFGDATLSENQEAQIEKLSEEALPFQKRSISRVVRVNIDNPIYVAIRDECKVILGSSSGARLKNAASVAKVLISDGATVEEVRAAAQWCRQDKYRCKNWLEPTFLQDGYTFLKHGKGDIHSGQQNSKIAGIAGFLAANQ